MFTKFCKERKKEKKGKKRKEEETTGWDRTHLLCSSVGPSAGRGREQGEEGKDSWREGETRRRGKRASSLRMSLLSPRLVHNLLLQSRVESRRRIFSGLLSSRSASLSDFESAETACNNPRTSAFELFYRCREEIFLSRKNFRRRRNTISNIVNIVREYFYILTSIWSIGFWTNW